MKKNALLFSIFLLFFCLLEKANAQGSDAWKRYRHDFTVGYGFNSLLSSIGEKDNIGLAFALQRSSFNLSYRYFLLKNVAVRGGFSQMYCRKNDKDVNRDSRNNLRMDYETSMSEISLVGEYHFFDETGKSHKGKTRRARGGITRIAKFGVSVYGGVALSLFNPQGEYVGNRVYLRPVNDNPGYDTDVDKYAKFNIYFPVGTNVRWVVSESWRVGVDLGYRFGVRPYVNNVSAVYYEDDVSQVGIPGESWPDYRYAGYVHFADEDKTIEQLTFERGKRGYFVGLITLSYRLKTRK
jgi:hypothetical protein